MGPRHVALVWHMQLRPEPAQVEAEAEASAEAEWLILVRRPKGPSRHVTEFVGEACSRRTDRLWRSAVQQIAASARSRAWNTVIDRSCRDYNSCGLTRHLSHGCRSRLREAPPALHLRLSGHGARCQCSFFSIIPVSSACVLFPLPMNLFLNSFFVMVFSLLIEQLPCVEILHSCWDFYGLEIASSDD